MRVLDRIEMSPGWKKIVETNPVFKGKLGLEFKNRPLEIYPGLTTTDPGILRVHEKWHRMLTDNWTAKTTNPDELLPLDWDALLARGGFVMSPVSIGMEDNSYLVEDLPKTYLRPEDKIILWELARVMFGSYIRSSLSIKKASSSGFGPTAKTSFVKDIGIKIELWKHGIDVVSHFKGKKLTPEQWMMYKVPCIFYCGRRTQPEGLKPREVYDGYNFVESSKDIGIPGFHAMRFRLVYGGAAAANYVINTAFTPIRKFYYTVYEKTFKVRFPEDLISRMSRFSSHKTIDVKSYDTTIQEWHFKELLKALEEQEILDPVLISLIETSLGGPSASNSPYPLDMGKPWRLVGDPFDNDSYRMTKGLMSGIATVSDFGRFFMSWCLLCELNQITGDVIGNVDRYLEHQMPLAAFCNSSDDNYMGAASETMMSKWMKNLSQSYFKIEPQDQLEYLGTQYYYKYNKWNHAPVLRSSVVKWDCPEYSISNMVINDHRPDYQAGFFMRDKYFDHHENYRDVYNMRDEIFKKEFGSSMLEVIRSVEPRRRIDSDFALTTADAIYLDNPDSIHYKINIEDVSKYLIDLDINVISEPEVTKCLSTLLGPRNKEYRV